MNDIVMFPPEGYCNFNCKTFGTSWCSWVENKENNKTLGYMLDEKCPKVARVVQNVIAKRGK